MSLIDSYSHSISSKALVVSINQGSSLTPPNPSFFPLTHQTNTLQYLALKLVCLLGWLLRLMLFGQLEAPGGVFLILLAPESHFHDSSSSTPPPSPPPQPMN